MKISISKNVIRICVFVCRSIALYLALIVESIPVFTYNHSIHLIPTAIGTNLIQTNEEEEKKYFSNRWISIYFFNSFSLLQKYLITSNQTGRKGSTSKKHNEIYG